MFFLHPDKFWFPNPNFFETITTFLAVNAFVPYPSFRFAINPVSWFISAEVFMCLLFPFISKQFRNNKYSWLVVSFLFIPLLSLACIVIFGLNEDTADYLSKNLMTTDSFLKFFPPARLFQFATGMAFAKIIMEKKFFTNKRIASNFKYITMLMVGIYLLCSTQFNKLISYCQFIPTIQNILSINLANIFQLIASLLIIYTLIAGEKTDFSKIFTFRPISFLGKLSYQIFLFHPLVGALMFNCNGYNQLFLTLRLFIYFSILILLAYILRNVENKFGLLILNYRRSYEKP